MIQNKYDELNEISNEFGIVKNGLEEKYKKKIKRMKMGKSSQQCSICYNQFAKGTVIKILPCNHIFCEACIDVWFEKSTTCPNCRLNLQKFFDENMDKQINYNQIKEKQKPQINLQTKSQEQKKY